MITRRSLFGILAGAVAAPIVVRSGLLMPVRALPEEFISTGYSWTQTYAVIAVTRNDVMLAASMANDLSRRIMAELKIDGPQGLRVDGLHICGNHGFQVGDIVRVST